jgi:hypothetical protein
MFEQPRFNPSVRAERAASGFAVHASASHSYARQRRTRAACLTPPSLSPTRAPQVLSQQ